MATLEKNRKFNVYIGNICYSGIEAPSAENAICMSGKRKNESVTKVTSTPIYSASIGVECDSDDVSEDAVYDIAVKGADEKMVDKIRDAIALAIGGLPFECKDGDGDDGRSFKRIVAKHGISIVAM